MIIFFLTPLSTRMSLKKNVWQTFQLKGQLFIRYISKIAKIHFFQKGQNGKKPICLFEIINYNELNRNTSLNSLQCKWKLTIQKIYLVSNASFCLILNPSDTWGRLWHLKNLSRWTVTRMNFGWIDFKRKKKLLLLSKFKISSKKKLKQT